MAGAGTAAGTGARTADTPGGDPGTAPARDAQETRPADPSGARTAPTPPAGVLPVFLPPDAAAATGEGTVTGDDAIAADPPPALERRRLEQHFVYNSLNTIASLIRTDPARARELLVGFAGLTRAADQLEPSTTLGREMEAVHDYLALEQARFGKRLQVRIDVAQALHGTRVEPLALLTAVRDAVQQDIEPRPQGGTLSMTATSAGSEVSVTVEAGIGRPRTLLLAR